MGASPAQNVIPAFPTTQLAILAICRLAEPIALTSILPYVFSMVQSFHIGDPSSAAFYAGTLVAAFSLFEAISSVFWGGLSDRIGRKPVLLIGCLGTMLSMLLMGFATNFWFALGARILGGVLNGNIGVIQTMVSEMITHPSQKPLAFSVMPFVWTMGCICGPAIGAFAYSAGKDLTPHWPFLLPNVICAGMLGASVLLGLFVLDETHPEKRKRQAVYCEKDLSEKDDWEDVGFLLDDEYASFPIGYDTFTRNGDAQILLDGVQNPTGKFTYRVVMLIIALGIYSYHSMAYDHLLPIFLQDGRDGTATLDSMNLQAMPEGGLGYSIPSVGLALSLDGLIAMFVQAIVFPTMARHISMHSLLIGTLVAHPIVYAIFPLIVFLPSGLFTTLGVYTCFILRNLATVTIYPVILILLNDASPHSSALGTINGTAASIGAALRAVAPPVAGYLYGFGQAHGLGAGLTFWCSAAIALAGLVHGLVTIKSRREVRIAIDTPGDVSPDETTCLLSKADVQVVARYLEAGESESEDEH